MKSLSTPKQDGFSEELSLKFIYSTPDVRVLIGKETLTEIEIQVKTLDFIFANSIRFIHFPSVSFTPHFRIRSAWGEQGLGLFLFP